MSFEPLTPEQKDFFAFTKAIEEFGSSPKHKAFKTIRGFAKHQTIYVKNYNNFNLTVSKFNKDHTLWGSRYNFKRWRAQGDIIRTLFNTITSIGAYISYCDFQKRKAPKSIHLEVELSLLKNHELNQLFRYLRNRISHTELPQIVSQASMTESDFSYKLLVHKSFFEIQKSDSKSKSKFDKAIDLINKQEERFDILPLLKHYLELVNLLHRKIVISIAHQGKEDIATLDGQLNEIITRYPKHRGSIYIFTDLVKIRYLKYLSNLPL